MVILSGLQGIFMERSLDPVKETSVAANSGSSVAKEVTARRILYFRLQFLQIRRFFCILGIQMHCA